MLIFLALLALLLAACQSDLRSRRVPNALVAFGALAGLAIHATGAASASWLAVHASALHGLVFAMTGLLLGLILLLPFYLLRTLGAGDVKLMAMVGAWIGAGNTLWAVAWTLVAGGVLSLAMMAATRTHRQVGRNVLQLITDPTLGRTPSAGPEAASRTTGQVPYALAIAAGTLFQVWRVWQPS